MQMLCLASAQSTSENEVSPLAPVLRGEGSGVRGAHPKLNPFSIDPTYSAFETALPLTPHPLSPEYRGDGEPLLLWAEPGTEETVGLEPSRYNDDNNQIFA